MNLSEIFVINMIQLKGSYVYGMISKTSNYSD